MGVERADLSVNLTVDQTSPVSSTPPVQGQRLPGERENPQRRRPPPAEEAAEEAVEHRDDSPQHKIDSLA